MVPFMRFSRFGKTPVARGSLVILPLFAGFPVEALQQFRESCVLRRDVMCPFMVPQDDRIVVGRIAGIRVEAKQAPVTPTGAPSLGRKRKYNTPCIMLYRSQFKGFG